ALAETELRRYENLFEQGAVSEAGSSEGWGLKLSVDIASRVKLMGIGLQRLPLVLPNIRAISSMWMEFL
ncbi:MAG: hypothetical protein AAFX51_13940, partial [Cyanobacteria bacterium J06636_28]